MKKIFLSVFLIFFTQIALCAETSVKESDFTTEAVFKQAIEEPNPSDVIFVENYFEERNSLKYNASKYKTFKPLRASEFNKKESNEYIKGNFSFNSTAGEKHDKYLRHGVERKNTATYQNDYFKLSAGTYTFYNENNASDATNEVFFSPSIKTGKKIDLEAKSMFDIKGEYLIQDIGFTYKPNFLKNGKVGVFAGTKFYKNATRSERFNFSTDFFLF